MKAETLTELLQGQLAAQERLERICAAFETAWQGGQRPDLASCVHQAPADEQEQCAVELILLDRHYRVQAGETALSSDYVAQFPQWQEAIEAALLPKSRQPADTGLATIDSAEQRMSDEAPTDGLRRGRFRLLQRHAEGGLGRVFIAFDEELRRPVALKELKPQRAKSAANCLQLVREAELTGRLEHPGVVPVYGLGVDPGGRPFYAMRLIKGVTLAEAVERFHGLERRTRDIQEDRLQLRKLLSRFVSVCQTIEYAHSHGVIHRDLKPANILLGEYGETLVADWGLARERPPADSSARPDSVADSADNDIALSTQTGAIVGTPAYMSPEQSAGNLAAVGPLSDVFSLGATLHAVLTGEAPPTGGYESANSPGPVTAAGGYAVPRALAAICGKALAHQPDRRYPSAAALAGDIEQWLAGNPVTAYREPWVVRCGRWFGRHRLLASGLGVAVVVAFAVAAIAFSVARRHSESQRIDGLVRRIEAAELARLPPLLAELSTQRTAARPKLNAARQAVPQGSAGRLNLDLAMLGEDAAALDAATAALLNAAPKDFFVLLDLIGPVHEQLLPTFRKRWQAADDDHRARLRLAAVLATFDPKRPEWASERDELAALLVREDSASVTVWIAAFRPIAAYLRAPLLEIFRLRRTQAEGVAASEMLAAFEAENVDLLLDLLQTAEPQQLGPLIRALARVGERAKPLLRTALADTTLPFVGQSNSDNPLRPEIALSRRQARAAVALFILGEREPFWRLLGHTSDPTLRTHIIHLLVPAEADPTPLVDRWFVEQDVSSRRTLLQMLGEYHPSALNPQDRQRFIANVVAAFGTHPDAGLHGAAEWLLTRWDLHEQAQVALQPLRSKEPRAGQGWYVNPHGQAMAVIAGPVEFSMGSPVNEWQRIKFERPHQRRIERSFAIGMHEITVADFRPSISRRHATLDTHYCPTADCPAGFIRWYQAARYCRWLGEQEGISEEQQCFPDNIGPDMELPTDYLERTGYRLPTEAEWEYACRAGVSARTYFGNDIELMPHYGWSVSSEGNFSRPVGMLKPNDLGLFDMLGNMSEWTTDVDIDWAKRPDWAAGKNVGDALHSRSISRWVLRVLRGGSFADSSVHLRSAYRTAEVPTVEHPHCGFRVARTIKTD